MLRRPLGDFPGAHRHLNARQSSNARTAVVPSMALRGPSTAGYERASSNDHYQRPCSVGVYGHVAVNKCTGFQQFANYRRTGRLTEVQFLPYQIAIVDDNDSVRTATLRFIHALGFTAIGFGSAESFLASECYSTVGCLLLDVQMPGMSGPQLQRHLQAQKRAVPIIFMTAHGDTALREALLAAGALAVLHKPATDREITQALRSALHAGP